MKRVTKIITGSVIVATTAGGIAYAKSNCGIRGPQHMAKHPDLNDEQQKMFQALIQEFRSTRQEMQQNRKQGRDEMLSLLNADKLDQNKAHVLVEGKTSAVRSKAPEKITTIVIFTDSLSPERRQQQEHGQVEITTQLEDNELIIRVCDHGEGIAEENLPYLIEPFCRVDPSRQRKMSGYGLGLHLCRMIAEADGGSLKFSSEQNADRTVTSRLPITPVTVSLSGDTS